MPLPKGYDGKKPHAGTGRRVRHPCGNYDRYYGYRNAKRCGDPRPGMIRKELLQGKRVLDVGCNSGLLTIELAIEHKPMMIVGVDVDFKLIKKARRNIKLRWEPVGTAQQLADEKTSFPYNVYFMTTDFMADRHNLHIISPEYDVILAFSLTKWIHLNHGDDGIKWFFSKCSRLLRQDGMLIIEPQPFQSYRRRKNLTPTIRRNFDSIKMMPEDFERFLVVDLDFEFVEKIEPAMSEKIDANEKKQQGFKRSIYIYKKRSVVEQRENTKISEEHEHS